MHKHARVLVAGAGGYGGLEVVRWLARHSEVELVGLASDRLAGRTVADVLPGAPAALPPFQPEAEALAHDADAALLCTPNEVSARLAPALLERGVKVVDLSGAFRLRDAALYPRWYGFAHPSPALLAEARWSLPELTGPLPDATRLVANPGCYVTAVTLALAPLLDAGLVERDGLVADAKSGASGAGRKAEESLLLGELHDNFYAYKVGRHQHTPEIEQALGAPVTLVTQLLPLSRGILATCHARAAGAVTTADCQAALSARYAGARFIDVERDPGRVSLRRVVGTNRAALSVYADAERRTVTAFAALDNLVKGAAGQAIQNLNMMVGLLAETGLEALAAGA